MSGRRLSGRSAMVATLGLLLASLGGTGTALALPPPTGSWSAWAAIPGDEETASAPAAVTYRTRFFVFFRSADVIAAGDIVRTDRYPMLDLSRGGSIDGAIEALNAIVELTVPERNQMGGTRVVPGTAASPMSLMSSTIATCSRSSATVSKR